MLKPIHLLPAQTNFHFVKYFRLCFGLSIAALIATAILLATAGLNFGIDFRGGTIIEIKTQGPADLAHLRSNLSSLGLGEIQLQTFGDPENVLVRLSEQPGGDKAQTEAVAKVRAALGKDVEIRRTETVGSTVSQELVSSAIWALVITNLGIFAYVWLRFEWQFALGAIVALMHDVVVTVGVFSAFQIDFDLTIVAALLTILGYSINDTVVIYDRIRENLRRYKRMPLRDLLDLSVNETMSRTIMTVGTVLMSLIALYIFGSEVIRGFTFAMLFGTVIGTYSSVYIAAPFLILVGVKRDWSGVGRDSATPRKEARAGAARGKRAVPGPVEEAEEALEAAAPRSGVEAVALTELAIEAENADAEAAAATPPALTANSGGGAPAASAPKQRAKGSGKRGRGKPARPSPSGGAKRSY
jgi:preprotein translocase SecF subunit